VSSVAWMIWSYEKRSADLAAWLQRNPITAAGALGMVGILAGLFIVGMMNPQAPRIETANARTVETTGSAPRSGWNEASRAKCREQTWPYISRSCLVRPGGSTRNVRVISTDSMAAPAAAAITTERVPNTRQPASPVVVTGYGYAGGVTSSVADARHAPAVQASDDSLRRRGREQYTAGKFINLREYDVPSYDNWGRRKRITVHRGDRYGYNSNLSRF
jgi:hypothetical protein